MCCSSSGSRSVEGLDPIRADDLLLHGEAQVVSALGRSRRLPGQGQLDAALGEHVVGGVQEVEDFRHADVGHGLVDDLLHLDRGDAYGQRGAEHDTVLTDRLAGDQGCQLHHEPRPLLQVVVGEDLVEGEVVEVLDQFRVGGRERGDAAGKQLVVVAPRSLAGDGSDSFTLLRAGQRSIIRCMASG